jgi:hypothetical protein
MQCVNLTDDELWQAIAHNTTVTSALVHRRIELDAGNARNDIIDRAQLMQSNLETISKLERKYGNILTSFAAGIPSFHHTLLV